MKPWQTGYINRNQQVNLGWLDRDNGESCYRMYCLACGEMHGTARAMRSRRCINPHCQYGGGQGGPSLSAAERAETPDERRKQAIKALIAALPA